MYETEPYIHRPNDFHQCFEYVTHDTRCTETAIKGEYFCPKHRIAPSPIIVFPDGGFHLPPLTDRDSILKVASEIAYRLGSKGIDIKRAGKILYACQLANSALDGKLRDQKLTLQQQKAATLICHSEPKAKNPSSSPATEPEPAPSPSQPVILSEARSAQSKDPEALDGTTTVNTFPPPTPDESAPTNENGDRAITLAAVNATSEQPHTGCAIHALKYSSDFASPSRSGILGSQPSNFFALVMSGRRRAGSSCGSGSNTISDFDPVTPSTSCAHSIIVNSPGFPMFTGPCSSDSDSSRMPSIRSDT